MKPGAIRTFWPIDSLPESLVISSLVPDVFEVTGNPEDKLVIERAEMYLCEGLKLAPSGSSHSWKLSALENGMASNRGQHSSAQQVFGMEGCVSWWGS